MPHIDERWRMLRSPDFTPYEAAVRNDPTTVLLVGADPFAPDPCMPTHVVEAVKRGLDSGRTHYSLANGYAEPELRDALVQKLAHFNGLLVDPGTELMVTPGSAFGLYIAMRICVTPGQRHEVLNFDPGFPENFNDAFQMDAVSVTIPTLAEAGFQFEPSVIESKITDNTRCIVLTHPNNPTGTVYDRSRMMALAEIAARHDLMVIVDQAFERQIYSRRYYTTFATLPGMRDRTLTVFGTSKDLGLSGFRVGYLVGPREYVDILKIATFNMHGPTNTFAQLGAAAAYQDPSFTDEWKETFARRRTFGVSVLNAIPGVSCPPPDGGFFFWMDIRKLGTSEEIRDLILREAKVGVALGTWFGEAGEGYLRVMFGTLADDERFRAAIERIAAVLRGRAEARGIRGADG